MSPRNNISKWFEPLSPVIKLDFTVNNARTVLLAGVDPNSRYTHRDIAHWCEKFWATYSDVNAPDDIERILPILADVETQWDLYLINSYKKDELESLEFDQVKLPREWFKDWIKQLDAEHAPPAGRGEAPRP